MSSIMLLLALLPAQANDQQQDRTKKIRVKEARRDVVLRWNERALAIIRAEKTPPPMAARALAMMHTAMYDAINTIYETHKPYRVSLRAIEPIDPEVAGSVAAHRVLVTLYPGRKKSLDLALKVEMVLAPVGKATQRGKALGLYVARDILAWRKKDNSDKPGRYTALPRLGIWRPTLPGKKAALLPGWVKVKPFGVKDVTVFRPDAPPKLTSTEFAKDYNEVKRLGGRTSLKRSAEQSIIAWFWDDGAGTCTPPGHWNQIAQVAALKKDNSLADNARLFALLNIALADASIACWDCKYHYKLWRPVTAIHQGEDFDNPDTKADTKWQSLLVTPPFPSYTSGHSTFSGAAAAILEKFFGTDEVAFTVGSDGYDGMTRSFKKFSDAAKEAGRSRIYGGIHYEFDNQQGQAVGRAIAIDIWQRLLLPSEQEQENGKGQKDQTAKR